MLGQWESPKPLTHAQRSVGERGIGPRLKHFSPNTRALDACDVVGRSIYIHGRSSVCVLCGSMAKEQGDKEKCQLGINK